MFGLGCLLSDFMPSRGRAGGYQHARTRLKRPTLRPGVLAGHKKTLSPTEAAHAVFPNRSQTTTTAPIVDARPTRGKHDSEITKAIAIPQAPQEPHAAIAPDIRLALRHPRVGNVSSTAPGQALQQYRELGASRQDGEVRASEHLGSSRLQRGMGTRGFQPRAAECPIGQRGPPCQGPRPRPCAIACLVPSTRPKRGEKEPM